MKDKIPILKWKNSWINLISLNKTITNNNGLSNKYMRKNIIVILKIVNLHNRRKRSIANENFAY